MSMTNENMGAIAAEKQAGEVKNSNSVTRPGPAPINTKPILNAEQIKAAAEQVAALTPQERIEPEGFRMNLPGKSQLVDAIPNLNSLDPYETAKSQFDDEIEAEERQASEVLAESNKEQLKRSGKPISDLIEDDAYDLNVPLYAGAMYNPNILKVELKDPNYVARWGNVNNIRQAMLAAQGFTFIREDDVRNLSTLSMFIDSLGHFVYADLVAMKIPKNVYYAGLRRAYLKSLHATNDKKARQGGAAWAAQELNRTLTGPERSYMANNATHKDIYTPVVGVG